MKFKIFKASFYIFFLTLILLKVDLSYSSSKEHCAILSEITRGAQVLHSSKGNSNYRKPIDQIEARILALQRLHSRYGSTEEGITQLKERYLSKHVVRREDIPESYYESRQRIGVLQGRGRVEITPKVRQFYADEAILNQKESLEKWVDYFISDESSEYPLWLKMWAFEDVTQMTGYKPGSRDLLQAELPQIYNKIKYASILSGKDFGRSFVKELFISESPLENWRVLKKELMEQATKDADKRRLEEVIQLIEANWDNLIRESKSKNPQFQKTAKKAKEALEGLISKLHPESSFGIRRSHTVGAFPTLDQSALEVIFNAMMKKSKGETLTELEEQILDGGKSFSRAYRKAVTYFGNDGEKAITDGQWVKFAQGGDGEDLKDSLACRNTGWCTAEGNTAREQLKTGDFYVYYSKDLSGDAVVPRLGIRMELGEIAEIRGVGKGQEIDALISKTSILEDKLDDFGAQGDIYLQKKAHVDLLNGIEIRFRNNKDLSSEDLRFLYEIDGPIRSFSHGVRDPRIDEILKTRNPVEDLARVLGVGTSEIASSSDQLLKRQVQSKANGNRFKYFYGDIDLDVESLDDVFLPEVMLGNNPKINLPNVIKAKNITLPYGAKRIDIPQLQEVSSINVPKTVTSLKLKSLKKIKELKIPTDSFLENLELQQLIQVDELFVPKTVKSLKLDKLESLDNVTLEPGMELTGLSLKSVKKVQSLTVNKSMRWLDLNSLENIQNVRFEADSSLEQLNLSSLKDARGLNVPPKVKMLSLDSLESAKGMQFDSNSELRRLRLTALKEPHGLQIPKSVSRVEVSSLEVAKGLKFQEGFSGDILVNGNYYRLDELNDL